MTIKFVVVVVINRRCTSKICLIKSWNKWRGNNKNACCVVFFATFKVETQEVKHDQYQNGRKKLDDIFEREPFNIL